MMGPSVYLSHDETWFYLYGLVIVDSDQTRSCEARLRSLVRARPSSTGRRRGGDTSRESRRCELVIDQRGWIWTVSSSNKRMLSFSLVARPPRPRFSHRHSRRSASTGRLASERSTMISFVVAAAPSPLEERETKRPGRCGRASPVAADAVRLVRLTGERSEPAEDRWLSERTLAKT